MCTREIDGEPVEFGTSGYTMDHVFVLYDRSSESVWYPSDDGLAAVSGVMRGESIPILDEPAPVTLGAWLDEHPASTVLLPTEADLERLRSRRDRPYLGVQLDERDDGLFISEVLDTGPARDAGFESGDRLLSLDGNAIDSRDALGDFMSAHAPGDAVEAVVLRAERELTLSVILGQR